MPSSGVRSGITIAFQDEDIVDVGSVALDEITSDSGTTVKVTLGDDAGDDFKIDETSLVVKGNTGKVGIGTTSPESALHVETAASHCAITLERSEKGTGEVGINLNGGTGGKLWYLNQQTNSDNLTFHDTDAARVTFEHGGNVGIGTASPSAKLEVSDDSAGPVLAKFRGSNDERLTVYQPSNGDWRLYPFRDDDSSYKAITIGNPDAGGLTVLGAGNVGINDTSPSYSLDVNGTARVVGAVTLDAGLTVPDGQLTLGDTAVTATATELNLLDGVSGLLKADLTKLAEVDATSAELNYVDTGAAAGTIVASKAVICDAAKDINALNNITVDGYVHFDATPADNKSSGVTATFTAGETLSAGEVCYIHTDGTMKKALADSSAPTTRCVAMALAGITNTNPGLFLLQGFFQCTGSFPTYTAGDTLYVPEAEEGSKAVPEATAPAEDGDLVQVVGFAVGTDTIYFNPNSTVVEVA